MNILILGHRGMLGHVVHKYLAEQGHNVSTLESRFPSKEFAFQVLNYSGDYIVNCIGAIPQKTKNFNINTELPIWLSDNVVARVVHPGTDCEIDEDEYGVSKRTARDYIVNSSNNTKIIRASIIGPELESKDSLLEWFLGSTGQVRGYTNAMWNGITTLEWAKQCNNLLHNWDNYSQETIVEGTCLSKYNLLSLIKEVFNTDIHISPDDTVGVDKCLKGSVKAPNIKEQLEQLKEYCYNGSTK